MTELQSLQRILSQSGNIVFFGGAGVSTESGLPDFRSEDGLYSQQYRYPPETMLSHGFFMAHPAEFYAFYREKLLPQGIRPNAAHKKLAELERAGRLRAVITQNIDGLHQMAGSRTVLELHGSVRRNHCMRCGALHGDAFVRATAGVPVCACGGIVKPDVVLYGEGLDGATVEQSIRYVRDADVLLVGGTSLTVYPAAGLIDYFRGSHLVLINRTPTASDERATLLIRGSIAQVLGAVTV